MQAPFKRLRLSLVFIAAALLSAHADDPASATLKGDGKADDTAALQSALDKIVAGPEIVLSLPVGNYRVTRPLIVKGPPSRAIEIHGASNSPGGGGSTLWFDGPPGTPCVLDIAGGFGVVLRDFKIDCRSRAQFGLYLHPDLPRTGMSNVLVGNVTIGAPLPGDSPLLKDKARSAAISIGLRPAGGFDVDQCDSIKLVDCTVVSDQGAHAAHYGVAFGCANVKNFSLDRLWLSGFRYGLYLPNGGGTCHVTGGAFLGCSGADFYLGSGILSVAGWESEASSRMLYSPGLHGNYASASFDRCAWYGTTGPDDAIASLCGALSIRGCDLSNGRTATSTPQVVMQAAEPRATSLVSEQNLYRNALPGYVGADGVPVLRTWNGVSLVAPPAPWIRTFGDLGGQGGKLVPLASLPAPGPGTNTASGDLVVTGSLTVSGPIRGTSIDLGGDRRWTPDGLFLGKDQYWTLDGLYPGIGVKWKGAGGLIGRPDGNLDWVDWVDRNTGTVVKSNRGRK